MWFCIASTGGRIEPEERAWLEELTQTTSLEQVPVIVVMTKSTSEPDTESLKTDIESMHLPIEAVIPVLADYWKINDQLAIKPFGLKALIAKTAECLPEALKKTLQNTQGVSVVLKTEEARKIIKRTSVEAFGIGFSPIPVSDAVLLIPLQIKMIAQITAVYGVSVDKSMLTAVISSTVGTGGATVLGKTLVVNLIKMIPGAGTAVGGMISGATAGALTTALGEAYIKLMEALLRGELKRDDLEQAKGKKAIRSFFENELRGQ